MKRQDRLLGLSSPAVIQLTQNNIEKATIALETSQDAAVKINHLLEMAMARKNEEEVIEGEIVIEDT